VPDALAERTVQGRAVVEGVHLMDPQPVEAVGVGLDGVEDGDRFAVCQRHDDIAVGRQVVEDTVG
jgi:hypothetical protein